jgi:SpoVK/Ycf46/Vps4 family AAA+-type ATPase
MAHRRWNAFRLTDQFGGPEYGISQIFAKARQFAPCYLIFEDLDSLVTDSVRSYFLNEIDGLQSNDGIFIVGSTNHLERLDPGISVSSVAFGWALARN